MMRLGSRYLVLATFLLPLGCSSQDNSASGGGGGGGGGGSASGGGEGSSTGTMSSGGGSSVGGMSGTTSSGTGSGGPDLPPAATRGATLPFWEYEAESAKTNGVLIGPSRAQGDIAAESSGRRAVRLEATGQKVELTLEHPTNSIVVRYAIPDAPGGGGIEATLGLYINGVRKQSLALTSRFAWLYGGESDSSNNTPGSGAHHFFDEVHALIDDLPVGATVTLQRDAEDTAAYYVVDLVDFEQVAPPAAQPAGSLSLTDFGATPDDGKDDGAAIQKAIDAAKSQGKVLWIPRGTFESAATPFVVSGVTIRGAGMWYSTLHGASAQFKVSGNDNKFHDFAIDGEVTARHDDKGENGFDGPAGTGSRLENIWIEHEKCGYWVGKGAYPGAPDHALTDGLIIHGV
ncbi:MAG: glycosyl hydrolase family 28-related protein, partial [Byssovorax sp.]